MRTAYNILLCASVFWGPLWFTVLLVLVGLAYFPYYFESVVAAGLVDILYSGGHSLTPESPMTFLPLAVYALLLYYATVWLRSIIRQTST